jgi:hypothetical protein
MRLRERADRGCPLPSSGGTPPRGCGKSARNRPVTNWGDWFLPSPFAVSQSTLVRAPSWRPRGVVRAASGVRPTSTASGPTTFTTPSLAESSLAYESMCLVVMAATFLGCAKARSGTQLRAGSQIKTPTSPPAFRMFQNRSAGARCGACPGSPTVASIPRCFKAEAVAVAIAL